MPFDFKNLPWKQWANSIVHAAIWRVVNRVPWWALALIVAVAVLFMAWK